MGATVVMACRSPEKGSQARLQIIEETKCAPSKVVLPAQYWRVIRSLIVPYANSLSLLLVQLLVLKLDLCSFDSVRQFVEVSSSGPHHFRRLCSASDRPLSALLVMKPFVAQGFKRTGLALHALVNNAGVMTQDRMVTPDGLEMVFTANHLSHFLLTNLLLPEIEKTG